MPIYSYVKKDPPVKNLADLNAFLAGMDKPVALASSAPPIIENFPTPLYPEKPEGRSGATLPKYPIVSAHRPSGSSHFAKILSFILISVGIGMLSVVIYPIAHWELTHHTFAPETKIVKPIPNFISPLSSNYQVYATGEEKDLTRASNWYPQDALGMLKKLTVKNYSLSIPELGIENANVIVGGEDLTKSLIHYKGSALPGEYGNAVIFGHSVLPEFFNPQNYSTIFATLPTIKVGDDLFVTVDKVEYKYKIYDMITVDPTDISVLEQKFDNYYLTAITCVPPGLKWKRLVVKAKLVPFE